MDTNRTNEQPSEFMEFLRNYKMFLISIAIVAFVIIVIGGALRNNAIEAAKNVKPDVKASFSNCKVIDKSYITYRLISYYVNTSCGLFDVDSKTYGAVEVGKIYDLDTVQEQGTGTPYMWVRY